jgi:PAS domain S-box-containing protein
VPEMRFVISQEGRLIDVNEAGVRLFGYGNREGMLREDRASCFFCTPEDRDFLKVEIEKHGFVNDYLVEMLKEDGTRFVASITATLFTEENGSISYEGVLRDASEYRRWQKAFIDAEKRKRDLIESEEQVRELNKQILQLLMLMSHDIRGPLVSMAATLKLLIRGTYGHMDTSVANTVNDLLTRVARLLGVVEDYLGKVQSLDSIPSKGSYETLDLRQDIIDPILDELSNDIEQFGIRIDSRLGAIPTGSIRVHFSKLWLKAVFRNLFKNAIKYGGRGCTIAFGFEDHGNCYRLNVYNTGNPIPAEHREKLFTKFGRIQSEGQRSPDGIGLGLYLIQDIIRRHGGDIWYEAKPGGSDFIFTLIKESC